MKIIINGHDYRKEVNEHLANASATDHPLEWLMRVRICVGFFQRDNHDARAEVKRLSEEAMRS